MSPNDQAVLFLARGVGGGLVATQEFLASYASHRAGLGHDLVILAKGWQPGERKHLATLVGPHCAHIIDLPDDGFDWGAYMRAAVLLDHDWIVFLNTHSRIEAHDWLLSLRAAAEQPQVGAAGATGSWGALTLAPRLVGLIDRERHPRHGSIRRAIDLSLSLPVRGLRRLPTLRRFPSFPNPHLRSNAFCIRRTLFLDFVGRAPAALRIPGSKHDAYYLENGRGSLTRFLLAEGLVPLVVGRDQRGYPPETWIDSATCNYPGQPNLLISDNLTRAYEAMPLKDRRVREIRAWGRTVSETDGGA